MSKPFSSRNTVDASSKETWCFLILLRFFGGSHSNRTFIHYIVWQILADARLPNDSS
jgi:hypothetical protein